MIGFSRSSSGFGSLAVVILFSSFACSDTSVPDPLGTRVQVSQGTVVGAHCAESAGSASARRFWGIPFAQPPVGELRWKPPQPLFRFARPEIQATERPAQCVQPGGTPFSADTWKGVLQPPSEDCLYLNVYAPPAEAPRPETGWPVMVFLFGGGYTFGDASFPLYDGCRLTQAHQDVILVVPNYRLGALGFLALPELMDESDTTGTWGILDQQMALRWVQENIEAFGGDPDRVLLFGQSAGGGAVFLHATMPSSQGLFSRALSESGVSGFPDATAFPLELAYRWGEALAAALGCDAEGASALACLRSQSAEAVTAALGYPDLPGGPYGTSTMVGTSPLEPVKYVWSPAIDGRVIVDVPQAMFARGYPTVPMLLGSNRNDGTVVGVYSYQGTKEQPFAPTELGKIVTQLVREEARGAIGEAYTPSTYGCSFEAATALWNDNMLICPTERAANSLASLRPELPLFKYRLDTPPPCFAVAPQYFGPANSSTGSRERAALCSLEEAWETPAWSEFGVPHFSELPFVFAAGCIPSPTAPAGDRACCFEAPELELAALIQRSWIQFAATGDPSGELPVAWPRYTSADRENLVFDARGVRVERFDEPPPAFASQCAIWARDADEVQELAEQGILVGLD